MNRIVFMISIALLSCNTTYQEPDPPIDGKIIYKWESTTPDYKFRAYLSSGGLMNEGLTMTIDGPIMNILSSSGVVTYKVKESNIRNGFRYETGSGEKGGTYFVAHNDGRFEVFGKTGKLGEGQIIMEE